MRPLLLAMLLCASSPGVPYLRWGFTTRPMPDLPGESWVHQESVTLVGPGEEALWTVRLPDRVRAPQAGIGRGEVEGYAASPRDTRGLAFLVGVLDLPEGFVVGDATGLLALDRRDGRTLLDLEAPADDGERLFLDRGRYEVSGAASCEGQARRGRFLAACGERIVAFDGSTLTVLSRRPLAAIGTLRYDRALHAVPGHGGGPSRVEARMELLGLQVRIEGTVYLR